ncbi:MAG: RtcB family protein [Nitrospinae bacterium]|nr:RtcB family protein [Nitrospinota bacterium]
MTVQIRKIDDYRWEVPIGYKDCMRVPGIIYTDEKLLKMIEKDNSIEQVANGACLPGIVKASLAMPDMHFGYGLAIGGVVATDIHDGVISPGATGYDINCGVRLVRSNLLLKDIKERIKDLVNNLYAEIPTGVGSKGRISLSPQEERDLLLKGAGWAVEKGYGTQEDLEHTEAYGRLEGADPDKVSDRSLERGKRQVGTLGSGNHFLEIQYVEEVYDEKAASIMGIEKDSITVMIHSGSRGFGHQVCTDYLEIMEAVIDTYGIKLPDRQLACAPFNSKEGKDYLSAMMAAANFAWANRHLLMVWTRDVFMKTLNLSPRELGMDLIYDVAHNIIKIEDHIVDGKKRRVAVHRKGATRAFPPGHQEIPDVYKEIGQPVIIPGDMGRASYLLTGTQKAMDDTFGSTCHGAGRCLSRHAAIKATKGRAIHRELEDRGIFCRAAGRETLREEFQEAYKDVTEVVNVVHNAGISKKVAQLKPLGAIKG